MARSGRISWKSLMAAAVLALGALLLALLASANPDRAAAASCSSATIDDSSTPGNLVLQGAGTCGDHGERFRVTCFGGVVLVDYAFIDDNTLSSVENTGIGCATVQTLTINGAAGADLLDVSGVAAASGFSALASDQVSGGSGGDTLLLRNGFRDQADCGSELDSAQADQQSVDVLSNCEIVDFLPEAVPAPVPPAVSAKKNCKRFKKRAKRRKCRRRQR